MKKKNSVMFVGLAVGIVSAAIICYWLYQNSHVKFADENMAVAICMSLGEEVTPEEVRYKDLGEIKELSIGFLGNYGTLEDIKKCRNVEKLYINGYNDALIETLNAGETARVLNEEETIRVEKELAEIVPDLKHLNTFIYGNKEQNVNIQDWSFLPKCRKLKRLFICYSQTSDYSFLAECSSLEEVDLWGSQIETADDLVNLKELKELCLFDTPLVANEEEVERICNALPNTKIYITADRIQNENMQDE